MSRIDGGCLRVVGGSLLAWIGRWKSKFSGDYSKIRSRSPELIEVVLE